MIHNIVPHFLQTYSLNAFIVQNVFETLDSCLADTIRLVEAVSKSLGGFNLELERLKFKPGRFPAESKLPLENEEDGIRSRAAYNHDIVNSEITHSAINSDIVDVVSTISRLSKATKNVLDHFERLPEALENGKEVLNIASAFGSSVSGLSTTVRSAKSAASNDVLSGVLTGVLEIAEASLPLSAATGVGALASLAALTLTAQLDEQSGGPVPFENFAPGRMIQFYMERERKRDYERLIELRHVSNYKQLSAVENELDSDYMVADRAKRVDKDLEKFEIGAPLLNNRWVVGTPAKRSKAGLGLANIPSVPEPVKLADEIKRIRDLAAFDSMGGKIDEKKLASDIANARKKFGKMQEPVWRMPSEQEWELHRRDELGLPHPDLATRRRTGRSEPVERGNARTINFNRALIEHLTITTTSSDEGVGKLKDQIEETLIGILNDSLM